MKSLENKSKSYLNEFVIRLQIVMKKIEKIFFIDFNDHDGKCFCADGPTEVNQSIISDGK